MDLTITKILTAAAAAVAMIALNAFLSTRKKAVFAFVLPALSFVASIVFIIIGFPEFTVENFSSCVMLILSNFFLFNIPTAVLIATGLITRRLYKKL